MLTRFMLCYIIVLKVIDYTYIIPEKELKINGQRFPDRNQQKG